MSTNYYFKVESECELHENYRIHIGKRSSGWEPSFKHTKHYKSVQEIRDFYYRYKDRVTIINEYGDTLKFIELEDNLINWNKNNKDKYVHEIRGTDYRDKEGYYFIKEEFS